MLATQMGHDSTVQLLVANGATVDLQMNVEVTLAILHNVCTISFNRNRMDRPL
jgi:hypothetical protein